MHTESYFRTNEHMLCFEFAALLLRCLEIKSLVGAFTPALNVFTTTYRQALGTFFTLLLFP